MRSRSAALAVALAAGWLLSLVAEAGTTAPTKEERLRRKRLGLSSTAQVPSGKITINEIVESPVDFGQLKPGAQVPRLPVLFASVNRRMDPKGKTFDLNAAIRQRPAFIVFWRG